MKIDIKNMNGYEFESFIATILRKIGFVVEETSLSGDSGVDLIAYSEEPLYKGKYLIQCKHWEGNVGEPVVRDLYGVVLSNNANKGILITNSFFTQQAKIFAEGKNIELINGNTLNELIHKYSLNYNATIEKTNFTSQGEFEAQKYYYLKKVVDTNKRNMDYYLDLFLFIYSYISNKKIEIMYSGLIEECLMLTDVILKKFSTGGKKGLAINNVFTGIKGLLLMLLGQVDTSFEIIHLAKKTDFNLRNFIDNLVRNICFQPTHFTYIDGFSIHNVQYSNKKKDYEYIIYKTNLMNLLVYINDNYGSEWLYKKYISYYNSIIAQISEEVHPYKQMLIDIANKNYSLATKQIESTINKNELRLFIPTKIDINKTTPFYAGLEYSTDSYIDIVNIVPYWSSELNTEKQIEKIRFLIDLNDQSYNI